MKKPVLAAALSMLLFCVLGLTLPTPVSAEEYRYPLLSDHYHHHGSMKLKVGETMALAPMMTEYDSERESYPVGSRAWTSRNPEIVSVASNGDATAHQAGTARITVTYTTNMAQRVTQTVYLKAEAGGGAVAPAYSLAVNKGKTIDLKRLLFPGGEDGSFQWTVKEAFLASVDKNGVLEAKGAGTGAVTAIRTDKDGETITKVVALQVMAEHHGSQNKIKLTLSPGDAVDIVRAVYPEETEVSLPHFSCRSDEEAVAAIDSDRRLVAKQKGSCTVTIIEAFRGEEEQRQTVQVTVR